MKKLEIYNYIASAIILVTGIIFLFFTEAETFMILITTIINISLLLIINYAYIKSNNNFSREINKFYNKKWFLFIILFLLVLNSLYFIITRKLFEIHKGGGGILDLSNLKDINNVLFFVDLLVFQINLIILVLLRIKKIFNIRNNKDKNANN